VAEQMLQHRCSGIPGVHALRDLAELKRIAEQHEIAGRNSDRERVRERDLTGLVDEQVVQGPIHFLPGEEPRSAGDELHVCRRWKVSVLAGALDELAAE